MALSGGMGPPEEATRMDADTILRIRPALKRYLKEFDDRFGRVTTRCETRKKLPQRIPQIDCVDVALKDVLQFVRDVEKASLHNGREPLAAPAPGPVGQGTLGCRGRHSGPMASSIAFSAPLASAACVRYGLASSALPVANSAYASRKRYPA